MTLTEKNLSIHKGGETFSTVNGALLLGSLAAFAAADVGSFDTYPLTGLDVVIQPLVETSTFHTVDIHMETDISGADVVAILSAVHNDLMSVQKRLDNESEALLLDNLKNLYL